MLTVLANGQLQACGMEKGMNSFLCARLIFLIHLERLLITQDLRLIRVSIN